MNKDQLGLIHRQVEWFFMGTDLTKPREGICKIHEYISPSMPPLASWKNLYKSVFNSQPDCRVFKNEYVRSAFTFSDRIPSFYQDIGIDPHWLEPVVSAPEKMYDFIYVGDLSARRSIEPMLQAFTRPEMKDRTLLLLSKNYTELQQQYQHYPNIIFRGPVDKVAVRHFMLQSRFGINYIPDTPPFNVLTSTKFLEYAACGLPIVTTDYTWVRQFQQQYGGEYFFLKSDFSNFTWEQVTNAAYSNPDLRSWTWENKIRSSGILEFLEGRFPELSFGQIKK
ncbi:MAG: glycosyltransferase [Chitinophagaceae bacterium]